jgi:Zn finger protein HypA/HybF involved in hydrogenase expression
MSTYTTKTERVNTASGFTAITNFERTIKSLEEAQVLLNQLVHRLHRAMKVIAENEGAFTCEHCGQYAFQVIEIASYSDEMGREVDVYCPQCAPVEVA